jgi:hypothetical protein
MPFNQSLDVNRSPGNEAHVMSGGFENSNVGIAGAQSRRSHEQQVDSEKKCLARRRLDFVENHPGSIAKPHSIASFADS